MLMRPPPLPTTAQIYTLRKLRDKVFVFTDDEPVYLLVHMVGDGAKALPRPCTGEASTCMHCRLGSEPAKWWIALAIVVEQRAKDSRSCELHEGVAALPLGLLAIFKDFGGKFRGRRCQLRLSGNRHVRLDHELGGLKVPEPVSVLDVFCDRWGYARDRTAIEREQRKERRQILCFDVSDAGGKHHGAEV